MVNHLAIVLDGNRRYAKGRGLVSWSGHDKGAEVIEELFEWAVELRIKMLTLYALSIDNLSREKKEVEHLFNLARKWFKKIKTDKRIKENQVRLKFIGELSLLPEDIQKLCKEIEESTKTHENLIVNFCLAYGGRQELVSAIKKIVEKGEKVSEENIKKNLWLSDEPELIIRTGDRTRTSNFLPWQAVYSEWIFLKKLWPEFTKADLIACIKKFEKIQRNFGK